MFEDLVDIRLYPNREGGMGALIPTIPDPRSTRPAKPKVGQLLEIGNVGNFLLHDNIYKIDRKWGKNGKLSQANFAGTYSTTIA